MVEYKVGAEDTVAMVIGFAKDGSPNVRAMAPTVQDYDKGESTFDLKENRHYILTPRKGEQQHIAVEGEGSVKEIKREQLDHPDNLEALAQGKQPVVEIAKPVETKVIGEAPSIMPPERE